MTIVTFALTGSVKHVIYTRLVTMVHVDLTPPIVLTYALAIRHLVELAKISCVRLVFRHV